MRTSVLALLLATGCSSGTAFDREKWNSADLSGRARAEMIPDLIKRHRLGGMSRDEVIALLGPPTTTDETRGKNLIYVLGNDGSMFPIDSEWLFIQLDHEDRVIAFEREFD